MFFTKLLLICFIFFFPFGRQKYKFYDELMRYLDNVGSSDGIENYSNQIKIPLEDNQVTFFIPSDEAVANIPTQKLGELRENTKLLLRVGLTI